jgi:hypothetical protein
LQATLEQTRRASERYLMVRCLDGLAEIALAEGNTSGCLKYADELLEIADQNRLREMAAVARRWRGEALLANKALAAAKKELDGAAALAEQTGRVRLQMDVQAALARLHGARGEKPAAIRHGNAARAIAEAIDMSLASAGLEARVRAACESRC